MAVTKTYITTKDVYGRPVTRVITTGTPDPPKPNIFATTPSELLAIAHAGGGVLQTIGSTWVVKESAKYREEQAKKKVLAEQAKAEEQKILYQKIKNLPDDKVLLKKTIGGKTVEEVLTQKEWFELRKRYWGEMPKAEKERRRKEFIKKSTPSVIVSGKEMSLRDYWLAEEEVRRRAKDPFAQFMYTMSKPISILSGAIGGAVSGKGGLESVVKVWKQEQIDIQKQLMFQEKARANLAMKMALEPMMIGTGVITSQILSGLHPAVTTTVSGGILGVSTLKFHENVEKALSKEISIERGRAVTGMGSGILGMALGAYGIQKSWQQTFPRKIEVNVKSLGKGVSQKKLLGEDKWVEVSSRDYLAEAGKRKFLAKGLSEGLGKLDEKIVRGFGRSELGIREIESLTWKEKLMSLFGKKIQSRVGEDVIRQSSLFKLEGKMIDKDLIVSRTIYGNFESKLSSLYHSTPEGLKLKQAGIDLTLKSIGLGKLKQIDTFTKIEQWSGAYPSRTLSALQSDFAKGLERTDIVTIREPSLDKIDVFKSSGRLDLKLKFPTAGLGEATTQISKAVMKDVVSGIVGTTTTTKITPITGLAPITSQISMTKQAQKLDRSLNQQIEITQRTLRGTRLDTITSSLQKLGTRLDTGLGTRLATGLGTRLDQSVSSAMAQKLDTGLAQRLDTVVDMPMSINLEIPTGGGGISLPDLDFSLDDIGFKRKRRKAPRARYKPSLEAVMRKIYGKPPKIITGLGLRKIPRRRRRRRRRKRK